MLAQDEAQTTDYGMGTVMEHKVYGKNAKEALKAVMAESVRLENRLSRFVPGSEVSRINDSAGLRLEKVGPETFEVLSRAVQYANDSQGLFDVTIGPLVDLWDYKHSTEAPDAARIKRVLPLIKWADLLLDPSEQTAGLKRAGQSVDLGGIGKGFASDRFLAVFREFEISSAFTNLGGNVAALGTKPDGSPWRVGIRHPRQDNRLLGAVSVTDKAVVTSGDYQRFFIDRGGKRRHHLLNPTTGYPAEAGLISVTTVADRAITADALSTLVFVAGMEAGLRLLPQFSGAELVLVDADWHIYLTRGLKDSFQAEQGLRVSLVN
ncbi:FAD:protein FMN transferase [Gorillibacterium sp. sgz500922]|uniref:FAD:protein FMN transferase n=1 Tax=Gorillibacterium sp. sgz500922 TaxID=3446694 RepID=UPI003F67B3C0